MKWEKWKCSFEKSIDLSGVWSLLGMEIHIHFFWGLDWRSKISGSFLRSPKKIWIPHPTWQKVPTLQFSLCTQKSIHCSQRPFFSNTFQLDHWHDPKEFSIRYMEHSWHGFLILWMSVFQTNKDCIQHYWFETKDILGKEHLQTR